MANDLVDASALSYLPGAPFTEGEVDAAVAAVRAAFEWHIAPENQDTVVFDIGHCQTRLVLPTRHLVTVDEIRVAGDVVTGYEVSTRLGQVIKKSGYWKQGLGTVEVDFTHGYETIPLDLLPVVAATATSQRLLAVRAPVRDNNPADVGEGVGGDVVSASPALLGCDAVERYSLRWLPGLA
jgi:hypothetical protein